MTATNKVKGLSKSMYIFTEIVFVKWFSRTQICANVISETLVLERLTVVNSVRPKSPFTFPKIKYESLSR